MNKQSNNIRYLRYLWKNNLINSNQFFFRKKCKELNITTKYLINEFWYNVYHKNQGQEVHTHLGPINPYWCGIYYNKNSSPTMFVKESGIHAVHNVPDWKDSKLDLFFLDCLVVLRL